MDLGEGGGCGDRRLDPKCYGKKSRERSSLREANESRFTQYSMEEYDIPRVKDGI